MAVSQPNIVMSAILTHPETFICRLKLEKTFREYQIRGRHEKAQNNQRKKWLTMRVEIET